MLGPLGEYEDGLKTARGVEAYHRIMVKVGEIEACVANCSLVSEAVPDNLAIKAAVFTEVLEHAPADAVIATNTLGLPIQHIQVRRRRERMLN